MKQRTKTFWNNVLGTMTIVSVLFGNVGITLAQATGTQCMLPDGNMNGVLTVTGCASQNKAFIPGSDVGVKNTFSGTSFTSVGGAIAGCANIGGTVSKSVKSLFSKKALPSTLPATGGECMLPDGSMDGNLIGGTCIKKTPFTNLDTSEDITQKISDGSNGIPVTNTAAEKLAKETNENLEKMTRIEQCLNGVAYAAAKQALGVLSTKMINVINSGNYGSATYVQDLPSYLKSIRDTQIQKQFSTIDQTQPVFGGLIRSVYTQQITGKTDNYIDTLTGNKQYTYQFNNMYCTKDYSSMYKAEYAACVASSVKPGMSVALQQMGKDQCAKSLSTKYALVSKGECVTAAGKNYSNFMGDFKNGGWDALLNSRNNPIGAIFDASSTLNGNITAAVQNKKDEIAAGNGFLNLTECTKWDSQVTSFGTLTGGITGQNGLNGQPKCLEERTITPGSVLAQQAALISTTGIRQLENADKINETLGSFFDQYLNRLFSKGIAGLSNKTTIANNGFTQSYTMIGDGISTVGGITNTAESLGYSASTNGVVTQDFDISRPQQLREIIRTQYNFLNRSLDAQSTMDRIVPTLGALDYCIPGPNPDWENGLINNFNSYYESISGDVRPENTSGAAIGSAIGTAAASVAVASIGTAAIATAIGATLGSAVPIVGTIIGGLLGSVVGKFVVNIFKPKDKAAYGAKPELYDKTLNDSVSISTLAYIFRDKVSIDEFKGAVKKNYFDTVAALRKDYSADNIREMFLSAADTSRLDRRTASEYCAPYLEQDPTAQNDQCAITADGSYSNGRFGYNGGATGIQNCPQNQTGRQSGVFTVPQECIDNRWYVPGNPRLSVPPAQASATTLAYVEGFVADALSETKKISTFNLGVMELDAQYEIQKSETQEALIELEAIRTEVLDIVGTAKARYIQEREDAGTPVDMSCIDKAYVIDPSPVYGTPPQEPGGMDPIVKKSLESKIYFYSRI